MILGYVVPITVGGLVLILGILVILKIHKWKREDSLYKMKEGAEEERRARQWQFDIAVKNKKFIERLALAVRKQMEKTDDMAPTDVESFINEWFDNEHKEAGEEGGMDVKA